VENVVELERMSLDVAGQIDLGLRLVHCQHVTRIAQHNILFAAANLLTEPKIFDQKSRTFQT
jgi:hypothetical protein